MTNNYKTVYRSKIDLWLWCLVIFALVVVWTAAIGSYWWLGVIYGVASTVLFVVTLGGCWYVIENDQLIVYQFFRPHKYPIGKIKDIKKTVGFLAAAGTSRKRVAITFTDRSVLKSSLPLEVSPIDRDGFMARLKQINPAIIVK